VRVLVSAFETLFSFFLVECFGVMIWDLLGRVHSLGSVEQFLGVDNNRENFHAFIVDEYKRLTDDKDREAGERYRKRLKPHD